MSEVAGDQIAPLRRFVRGLVGRACDRHADDAEVRRLPVAADHEVVADRVGLIFVAGLARQQRLEAQLRVVGGGVAHFGLQGALQLDEQQLLRLAAA